MKVLKLDIAGNPSAWMTAREAITLIASGRYLAGLGEEEMTFYGGINAQTGKRSEVIVNSIMLTREHVNNRKQHHGYAPALSNELLFQRDGFMCMYCGHQITQRQLSRDHVMPVSRGGLDIWENVVTCCKTCNADKADRTPEQWGRQLLAVPYAPNWAEALFLENQHRIIADQQAFLIQRFKNSAMKLM